MQTRVMYRTCDLSPEQRNAAEILLGHTLSEHEMVWVTSQQVHMTQPLSGKAREEAFQRYLALIDETAARAAHIPEEEIDAIIDEACAYVRSHPK